MTFRIGFVTGAMPDRWVDTWRQRRREPIELVPVAEEEQERLLRDGTVDMAIVRLPVDRDGLHLVPLYEDELRYCLDEGANALYRKLEAAGVTDVVDPRRPSVV